MVEETLQRGRRAIDRQSELLTHYGDGDINVLYATQHVGYEVTALEAFRVTAVGHLVVGSTVNVIEYWSRQTSFGQTSEIMKVVTVAQLHACSHPIKEWEVSPNLSSRDLKPTTDLIKENTQKP
jgi:hypothetical protein